MKKISRVLDYCYTNSVSLPNINPENLWVTTNLSVPTIKFDGTACYINNGKIFKRYNPKLKKELLHLAVNPYSFHISHFQKQNTLNNAKQIILCNEHPNPVSGSFPLWIQCQRDRKEDAFFFEAFDKLNNPENGTYELIGQSINGNKHNITKGRFLIKHGSTINDLLKLPINNQDKILLENITNIPNPNSTEFINILNWIRNSQVEGIVFHHKENKNLFAKLRRIDLTRSATKQEVEQFIQQGNKIRMQHKTQSNKDKVEAISISEIRDWHQLLQSDFNEQLFS